MSEQEIPITKVLIPPVWPKRVPRPRLINGLNDGLHRKLTLTSAPAGFGKTASAAERLNFTQGASSTGIPIANRIAWLTLDRGDNDPARFLTSFLATLNQIGGLAPALGKDP